MPEQPEFFYPGTVYADWAEESYPAVISSIRWNGWANPFFTREIAERVVADIAKTHEEYGEESDLLEWDGDNIIHHRPQYADEPDYEPTLIEPIAEGDLKGLYPIGGWEWTWWVQEGES